MNKQSKKETEDILERIHKLQPKAKERAIEIANGICDGKTKWEVLKCDELPLFLACHPEYILEYGCIFIVRFIKSLFRKLNCS